MKNKLKDIRLEMGMTQNEFKKLIGIASQPHLARIENGSSITVYKALEIAKKLDKKVEDIWEV